MKKYTNTKAQRAACDTLRDADIDQLKHLTNAEVWVLAQEQAAGLKVEAERTAALVERIAPLEALAVVEYGADEYTAALDEASMVPQGLSKFDLDELQDAAAIIAPFTSDGLKVRTVRTVDDMAVDFFQRSGKVSLGKAKDTIHKLVMNLCLEDLSRIEYPVKLDIGSEVNDCPVQIIFVETPRGSLANTKGEAVWAVVHCPELQTYDRGQGVRTGLTKYDKTQYTGIAAIYPSYEAGRDAQHDLALAVKTFQKIRRQQAAAGGDARYTADPVRTAGIDFDKLTVRAPQTQVI